MNEVHRIFDRQQLRAHRDRAASKFVTHHQALASETAAQLLDRIIDIKRDFTSILDLGSRHGFLAQHFQRQDRLVVAADLSDGMLKMNANNLRVVADEEYLPFLQESFDLIVSNLNLHWVNDLPGALAQIKRTLKPDGLFLAAFLGGQTLHELRACLLEAELTLIGGVRPRLSPYIDLQTASGLLQRAGFHLPVTDRETMTLTYPDMMALMHDLRGMGETNVQTQRARAPTRRSIFALADRLYRERNAMVDERIPATFEVIFVHGWRPA